MEMLVDLNYYTNTFLGGSIDSDTFAQLNMQSQTIILKSIIHRTYDEVLELDSDTITDVKNAICSQISFLNSNGGMSVLSGNNTGLLTSESYSGSYSYSKQENQAFKYMTYVNGVIIAPMVYTYLANTGLLYAGVDLSYER